MILTISNSEYHARPEISNSGLKLLSKSPAHFKAGYSGINPDSARIGTASHSMVLEGGKDVVSIPDNIDVGRASGKDRAWWAEWFEDNHDVTINTKAKAAEWYPEFERLTGKTIVSAQEKDNLDAMYEQYLANHEAVELLEDTEPEISIFQTINGVECKSRPDAHNAARIIDVKTTDDASERGFARACATYGYHRQEAFYCLLHQEQYGNWPVFKFIVQEKTKPFTCVVYELDIAAKENGLWLVERDLELYKQCLESGEWPSYQNNYELSIPLYERPPEIDFLVNGEVA